MGEDFEFYCLQLKNPVGIPTIVMLFPVGMRVQCSFPMGMKLQGIFLTGDKFSADFSSGEGVLPGLWQRGVCWGEILTSFSIILYGLFVDWKVTDSSWEQVL